MMLSDCSISEVPGPRRANCALSSLPTAAEWVVRTSQSALFLTAGLEVAERWLRTASGRSQSLATEFRVKEGTGSGTLARRKVASQAVHELRRISGLTWEQLAHIFDVSVRTLHLWASGKPINSQNESKLHRVLAFVYKVDKGAPSTTRSSLLKARREDGLSALELLRQGRFSEAESVAEGKASSRRTKPTKSKLSEDNMSARRGLSLADILQTIDDDVPKREGRLLRGFSGPLNRQK